MIGLKIGASVVVLGLLVWLGFIVNGWRVDAAELPVVEAARDQAIADRDAQLEAARKAAIATRVAEQLAMEAAKKARKIRIVYREAVANDPECSEWSRARVACPLDGLRNSPTTAPDNLPGHTE